MKVALVLCGGGLPAVLYEIGALAALDDLAGPPSFALRTDILVGVSAGASVAALLANGEPPHLLYSRLASPSPNPHLELCGALGRHGSRGFLRSLPALARILGRAIRYCLRSGIRPTLSNLAAVAREILPPGLASLGPWEERLAAFLSSEGRRNSFGDVPRELIFPAYDLDSGERVVFGTGGREDVPISLAVAASSAFPALFHPVRVGERDLVDGGIGKAAHADLALERGAALVIIINPMVPLENDRREVCLPSLEGRCSTVREKGLFYIGEQIRRISRREKLELGLHCLRAEHPEVDILLVEPRRDEAMLFMQGLLHDGARAETLRYGYLSAAAWIRENYAKLEAALRRLGLAPDLGRLRPPMTV